MRLFVCVYVCAFPPLTPRHRSKHLTRWIASEIISTSNPSKRVEVMCRVIAIVEQLYLANNFQSMMNVLSGLNHGAVLRLKCVAYFERVGCVSCVSCLVVCVMCRVSLCVCVSVVHVCAFVCALVSESMRIDRSIVHCGVYGYLSARMMTLPSLTSPRSKTWAKLSANTKKTYDKLTNIVAQFSAYKVYRKKLTKRMELGEPVVPCVGACPPHKHTHCTITTSVEIARHMFLMLWCMCAEW